MVVDGRTSKAKGGTSAYGRCIFALSAQPGIANKETPTTKEKRNRALETVEELVSLPQTGEQGRVDVAAGLPWLDRVQIRAEVIFCASGH